MSLIKELNRRNVFKVGVAYVIVTWLLLQVADVILPTFRTPDWVMQAFTFLLILGFPLALIFAWAFELTPEGLKKEKDVDRSQSISHITGRKLDFVIIGVLAIAVVYFVTDKFYWTDGTGTEPKVDTSIAVLPFVPLSSGEDDGYFADGLTEEILNALAQLPELQVTARTSSFFFKGQNIPVPEIADRLDVAHVVEGSVRRDGKRVRITAQLIRASDDFHLWSQTYDRTLDDVFAVQEDIAEKIAEVLNVVLDDNTRRIMRSASIRDVEAFIAYQKGREAFDTAHEDYSTIVESLAIANAYFDQALEATPGLTMARLLKADRAGHIILGIAAGLLDEEYPGEAQEALAALREDYDLARQLSPPGNQRDILDLERTLFSEDWNLLPDQIERALQPSGCVQMSWTASFIMPIGWAEQVAEKFRDMLTCDPMDIVTSYSLSYALIWAGDPEGAMQAVDEAESRGLRSRWLDDARYQALLAAGRINDTAMRGPGSETDNMMRQIVREALAGDPGVARQMAETYWSRPDASDITSLVVAGMVGDRERANEIAARIDANPGSTIVFTQSIYWCFCEATFDLEATPNFKARIEEAGIPWPPPKPIDYPNKTW